MVARGQGAAHDDGDGDGGDARTWETTSDDEGWTTAVVTLRRRAARDGGTTFEAKAFDVKAERARGDGDGEDDAFATTAKASVDFARFATDGDGRGVGRGRGVRDDADGEGRRARRGGRGEDDDAAVPRAGDVVEELRERVGGRRDGAEHGERRWRARAPRRRMRRLRICCENKI